ncbi:hexokinase-4-like [Littorina saxatilis]|uniref:hexokinase-4-like n=1 Tax=Littorina saxatilis TaxID=31220 RepID=UPI0038B61CE2
MRHTSLSANGKTVMEHLKRFLVGPEQIGTLMKAVRKELDDYRTPQTTSSNMFCTTVQALPNKTETGDVLVMNLGTAYLHVLIVKLRGEDINADEYMTYKIPADVRTGTSNQLMEFIADRVSMFLKIKDLLHKSHSVGFVLSFPCKYDTAGDLTTARLAKWTKGFCCKDVEDKKWRELLQQAFKKKTVCKLEIKAIVNNLVALFMSAVREDDKCSIAVVFGNGFSACYLQQGEGQSTSGNENNTTEKVIVSTESGALGEDGSLDDLITEFDKTLDQNTVNPGKQILEKMIGSLYLGEIVRLVLLKLIKQGLLFSALYSEYTSFNKKGGFSTEHVALIQSDTSDDHSITQKVLQKIEVDSFDAEDCNIVKYVCRIVFQRAAYLAAAGNNLRIYPIYCLFGTR